MHLLLLFADCLDKNVSKEVIDFWWRNESTFDLEDFLEALEVHSPAHDMVAMVREGRDQIDPDVVAIEEVSSTFGRCYLFKAKDRFLASH